MGCCADLCFFVRRIRRVGWWRGGVEFEQTKPIWVCSFGRAYSAAGGAPGSSCPGEGKVSTEICGAQSRRMVFEPGGPAWAASVESLHFAHRLHSRGRRAARRSNNGDPAVLLLRGRLPVHPLVPKRQSPASPPRLRVESNRSAQGHTGFHRSSHFAVQQTNQPVHL